jgi:hypothetical protein
MMLPLSYQGFGFTAILLMVLFLSFVEAVKWLRGKTRRNAGGTSTPEPAHADSTGARVIPLNEQIPRDAVGK